MSNLKDFAKAIALRLSDEWDGTSDFPEDAEILRDTLVELLTANPAACRRLIGTGIIENNYFDDA